jgi:hypothetical protein
MRTKPVQWVSGSHDAARRNDVPEGGDAAAEDTVDGEGERREERRA